jgi:hypothetical protein
MLWMCKLLQLPSIQITKSFWGIMQTGQPIWRLTRWSVSGREGTRTPDLTDVNRAL